MANDFYVPGFSISYIPFFHFLEGSQVPEKMKAVLFYVHHDQRLDQVNSKLDKAGCRPMKRQELNELFRMQAGILAQSQFEYLLATDPSEIEDHPKGKVVHAIDSDCEGEMKIIRLLVRDFLPNHAGYYVAAVKKE